MDTVYFYWHPEQSPKPKRDQDRDGFMFPFKLVILGWKEWKKTGIYPNPYELARRINPDFVADIDHLDTLIESARPAVTDESRKTAA